MNFGTMEERCNSYKNVKDSEWKILVTHLNNFWIFQLWPQISPKCALENFFKDFWLKRPSRRCRTRIWPKTGSSFGCHFGEKAITFGFFLGISNARCYRSKRSIFGPISSFMEPHIRGKFQVPSLNTTYFSHGRLRRDERCGTCVWGHIQPPIPCRRNKIFHLSLQFTILEDRCC